MRIIYCVCQHQNIVFFVFEKPAALGVGILIILIDPIRARKNNKRHGIVVDRMFGGAFFPRWG